MGLRQRMAIRVQRALRRATPAHVVRTRITKRTISQFAEKVGLVYFGYVDQRDDDHRLVRGHTVSRTHVDNHYCIGTVNGYDVVLVSRNDMVRARSGKLERCHWLIYTIDLHTKQSVPHMYVGHKSRDAQFAASYEQLMPLSIGHFGTYSRQFLNEYTVYGKATHALEIEQYITPQVAEVIASHFRGASFEVEDSTVFLYVESEHPSEALLEKLLSNGLWLAEVIDTAAHQGK